MPEMAHTPVDETDPKDDKPMTYREVDPTDADGNLIQPKSGKTPAAKEK